jgi:hypothetical protein
MLTRGALLPLHYLGRLIVEEFRWCSNAMTTDLRAEYVGQDQPSAVQPTIKPRPTVLSQDFTPYIYCDGGPVLENR